MSKVVETEEVCFWMVEHATPTNDGKPRWARWFNHGFRVRIEWTTDWERATHYASSESARSSASCQGEI